MIFRHDLDCLCGDAYHKASSTSEPETLWVSQKGKTALLWYTRRQLIYLVAQNTLPTSWCQNWRMSTRYFLPLFRNLEIATFQRIQCFLTVESLSNI